MQARLRHGKKHRETPIAIQESVSWTAHTEFSRAAQLRLVERRAQEGDVMYCCCCCSKACKAVRGMCRALSRLLSHRMEETHDLGSSEELMKSNAMELGTTVYDTTRARGHIEMVKANTAHSNTPQGVQPSSPQHTSTCASSEATSREEKEGRGGSQLRNKTAPRDLARGKGKTITTPQSPSGDSLTPLKCVDCEKQLSAEVIRQHEEQGEALFCDTCRTAHLRFVQDGSDGMDFLDEASGDTQLSPDVVSEKSMCKLPGCPKQAKTTKKSKRYKGFCSKQHYQMYSAMTPTAVSPTSPTAPSQSGGDGSGGQQGGRGRNGGGGHTPQLHPPTPRSKVCKLPGCQRPCYVERDGHAHDFCGRSHAQQYQTQQTRSSRAVQHQPTEDDHQGKQGWFTGKIGGFWSSNSSSHTNSGNPTTRNTRQRGSHPIKFYHRHEPYYEFTNFYQAPLQIDCRRWATSENYFQAQKYIGTPLFDAIQQSQTAREAFDISRTPDLGLQWRRSDWEEVKDDVMYVALYAKFTQHERLWQTLLDTGERKLVEHTSNDSYWGDGGDGSGQNRLGQLLMKLRDELRKDMEAATAESQGGRKSRK